MLIRVKGKISKITYENEKIGNMLIALADRAELSVVVDKAKPLYEKMKEGKDVDLCCTIRVKTKEKDEHIFYNNIIYAEGEFGDVMSREEKETRAKFKGWLKTQSQLMEGIKESKLETEEKKELVDIALKGMEQIHEVTSRLIR